MNISVFDVTGPVMIGPSSSHTAGAARLAYIARLIAGKPFHHVVFGLHGSFAKTWRGHGTDRALVAGALGLREDDERLPDAFRLAEEQGLTYEFQEIELERMHENSVQITFSLEDGKTCKVIGSSIGGAQVVIRGINGFDTEFSANSSTLVIRQEDKSGVVSEVSRILAENGVNIGVMRLSRRAKGDIACCIIEMDSSLSDAVVERIRGLPHIRGALAINIDSGGA